MGGGGIDIFWNYSMLSSEVTYYYKYGRYSLIGYHFSKIENLLLLAECGKENIRFVDRLNVTNNNYCCVKCDLRASLHKVKIYTISSI